MENKKEILIKKVRQAEENVLRQAERFNELLDNYIDLKKTCEDYDKLSKSTSEKIRWREHMAILAFKKLEDAEHVMANLQDELYDDIYKI